MFTGLVETKGLIDSFEKNEDGMILRLNHIDSFDVSINDSVSCNGVCLTVINTDKNSFEVQLVNETLNRTCLLYTSPSPRDPKTSRMPSSA